MKLVTSLESAKQFYPEAVDLLLKRLSKINNTPITGDESGIDWIYDVVYTHEHSDRPLDEKMADPENHSVLLLAKQKHSFLFEQAFGPILPPEITDYMRPDPIQSGSDITHYAVLTEFHEEEPRDLFVTSGFFSHDAVYVNVRRLGENMRHGGGIPDLYKIKDGQLECVGKLSATDYKGHMDPQTSYHSFGRLRVMKIGPYNVFDVLRNKGADVRPAVRLEEGADLTP